MGKVEINQKKQQIKILKNMRSTLLTKLMSREVRAENG